MPTFCRHNRFLHRCPICSREQPAPPPPRAGRAAARTGGRRRRAAPDAGPVRVRRLARGADDGYRHPLVPGLRSAHDARRLADELSFAAGRLTALASAPFGPWSEAAAEPDLEEALWLCFLTAYLGALEGDDPWAGVRAARTPWATGGGLAVVDPALGPRGAQDPAPGHATVEAYRAWAARAGSQAAALTGDASWSPERRFGRAFERLALPGLGRPARFELLVGVGRLELVALRPDALHLGGDDETTLAAKRVFAIADPLVLERRAGELAAQCEVPLEALDLALFNWARPGARFLAGAPAEADDAAASGRAARVLRAG